MGQKTSPTSLRLGLNRDFAHTWFADRLFSNLLHQQLTCQRFLKNLFEFVGVRAEKSHVQYIPQGLCIHSFFCEPGVSEGKWRASTLKPTPFFKDLSHSLLFQLCSSYRDYSWSLVGDHKKWKEAQSFMVFQYFLLKYHKAKSNKIAANSIRSVGERPVFYDYAGHKSADKQLQFYKTHIDQIMSRYADCNAGWSPIRILSPAKTASFVANQVVHRLEQNTPIRQIFKTVTGAVKKEKSIQGFKISCAGRLGGSELAHVESKRFGQTPLHTLSQRIDYASVTTYTPHGLIGVKVWIAYKSPVLRIKKESPHAPTEKN